MNRESSFWQDKKIFLTGHTGFKGSWLALWLQKMGANVCGYALQPITKLNLFTQAKVAEGMCSVIADIRDEFRVMAEMETFQPEIVIHMAAQPLVRYSYHQPVETYQVNVMGTVNVLEAARHTSSVRAVVNITSDKCYENREMIWGYRENESMGGFDPYSSSKGCAELVTNAYRNSYFNALGIGLASARAGNVIGGGDWANDRLVPDIIRSCIAEKNIAIRFPNAIRPWQHVLEPLAGYLILAQSLYNDPTHFSEGWNFGPSSQDVKPVSAIVEQLLSLWGGVSQVEFDETSIHPHEAQHLSLDCSKACLKLGWSPRWKLRIALEKIIEWHRIALTNNNMREFTLQQIDQYLAHSLSAHNR